MKISSMVTYLTVITSQVVYEITELLSHLARPVQNYAFVGFCFWVIDDTFLGLSLAMLFKHLNITLENAPLSGGLCIVVLSVTTVSTVYGNKSFYQLFVVMLL